MARRAACLVLFLSLVATLAGCKKPAAQAAAGDPAVVPVARPVLRPVTEFVEYTGRADAVETVGIKARATGYLVRAPFTEGAEVKKGDLLFEIDPARTRPSSLEAEAQVKVAEANLVLAQASYNRVKNLTGTTAVAPGDRPGAGRRRRCRRRFGRPRPPPGVPPEPPVHQGDRPDRRASQPVLLHRRQPGQPGPDAPDDRRLDRPHVRLLRHGRADVAPDPDGH